MSPSLIKRKKTVDSGPDLGESDEELANGLLDGILSASDEETDDGWDGVNSDASSIIEGHSEGEEAENGYSDSDDEETEIRTQIRNLDTSEYPLRRKPTSSRLPIEYDDAGNGELDESNETIKPNFTVATNANGSTRYIYKEINPVYDSDESDAEATNTIGNIPLSYYDQYPHIGYDINGRKIMRPAQGEALDALLDSIDIPKGWTGLTDPETGKPLQLSADELDVLKKLTRNEMVEDGYDPYPDMVAYFSGKLEIMPLSAAPEPKRRFVPSKHEAKRVMKIVKAIREGRIKPYREQDEELEEDLIRYDLWADEKPRLENSMHIAAPKLPPPSYEASYHPPPEYLPDEIEKQAFLETDDEDREREFLPKDYEALRKVPGYENFVKERFERSLDLYLAPRIRRKKLNIDPESLLPKLPNPDELKPFPSTCAAIFRGHEGRVRSVSIDPSGVFVASGGDDGFVRIWELTTGYQVWKTRLSNEEAIDAVQWRPTPNTFILAAATGENIYLIVPWSLLTPDIEAVCRDALDAGWGYAASKPSVVSSGDDAKQSPGKWSRPGTLLENKGVLVLVQVRSAVKIINWHRRGDYFATVSPRGQSTAVAIHTLSKHLTQLPFRRLRGIAQTAQFHPSRAIFFVATRNTIRSYDLAKQELVKVLQPGAKWISSMDVHPGGDNIIVGTYDKRVLWHDLDLSTKPYKTLRFHKEAVRAVKFHQGGFPLFADASDDGSLQVFHGKVVNDMMENATIVPVKVLKGHKVKSRLGVMDLDWHPRQPWFASAGADGTLRLWN